MGGSESYNTLEPMNLPTDRRWKILFTLWSIQGLFAFIWILMIPTDTENPLVFGFSTGRVILLSATLVPVALFAILSYRINVLASKPFWRENEHYDSFVNGVYVLCLLAVFISTSILMVFDLLPNEPVYAAYQARLSPLLGWAGVCGLEGLIFIGWSRYQHVKTILDSYRPALRNVAIVFGVLCALGALIALTGIGITPEDNWGGPPVPFFEWQILLTLLIIVIVSQFAWFKSRINTFLPPALIYLLAVTLWLSQPVNPSPAATPPRAPNFEIYPFSDPQFYAQYAQSALTGSGFLWPEVPSRPFYVAVLTWLHFLGGQTYEQVILLQSLLLAFSPVVLYLLGKEIGGWQLGLGLSILTVFRDINANHVVLFANNVTYSKLFLSEIPAALFISLATLLFLHWQRLESKVVWRPLLIGGVVGAATLIRLQSAVLVVVIILLTLLTTSNRKQWARGAALLIIGMGLTIAPWIIRNYYATGGLVLDNPISQTMTMARRWSGDFGNELIPRLPNENDAEYSNRLTRLAVQSLAENPAFVLRTTANHFINSEIASLLAFPIRDKVLSPSEILLPRHAFWNTPLSVRQLPVFTFNLVFFALGLVMAWQQLKFAGVAPLALGVAYNLWTGLFFSSGVRFIVPVDWSVQLYQFYGLLLFCGFLISFVKTTQVNDLPHWLQPSYRSSTYSSPPRSFDRRWFILSLILILILGGFTPFTEFIFPQKYPSKVQEDILRRIGATAQPGEIALYGRALYPRYYESGDGEPGTAKLGYGAEDKSRLVFFLVGPNKSLVVFGLNTAPEFFPHASDVYMVGSTVNGYFSPRIVKVEKDFQTETYGASQ